MGQQCVLNSRHTDCTYFETLILDRKICVRGQQCTWKWTLYKHFDITRQKNVGGGLLARVGWGRGWETVARTGLQWKIYVSERAWWALSAVITAWREGVNARPPPPLPLDGTLVVRPNARRNRWLGPRTRPHSPRAFTPPLRQISKKTQKYDRNIEADLSIVFSYTRVRQCSPIGYMIG
jgi:hypothetical protein